MVPLHSIGQDDQNEVQHDFGHVISLALASAVHDANDIINGIIPFLIFKKIKNEVQHEFLGPVKLFTLALVSSDDSVINSIIVFFKSKWLKWGATLLFVSCDAICISITWY